MTGLEVWRVCDYVHVPHRNHVDGRPCRHPKPLHRCVACGCLVDAVPTQETLTFVDSFGGTMVGTSVPGDCVNSPGHVADIPLGGVDMTTVPAVSDSAELSAT